MASITATSQFHFEYPPQKVAWTKRDVILFAYSIGCNSTDQLHYLYVRRFALPSFELFVLTKS